MELVLSTIFYIDGCNGNIVEVQSISSNSANVEEPIDSIEILKKEIAEIQVEIQKLSPYLEYEKKKQFASAHPKVSESGVADEFISVSFISQGHVLEASVGS
jgi:hypothetical protein